MSKQREALQVALEALEKYGTPRLNNEDAYSAAIKTIREALAESERKPLTEPELHAIEPTWPNGWNYDDVLVFVRSIERAHGINEGQKPLT